MLAQTRMAAHGGALLRVQGWVGASVWLASAFITTTIVAACKPQHGQCQESRHQGKIKTSAAGLPLCERK
jgi:hypothetical protein